MHRFFHSDYFGVCRIKIGQLLPKLETKEHLIAYVNLVISTETGHWRHRVEFLSKSCCVSFFCVHVYEYVNRFSGIGRKAG